MAATTRLSLPYIAPQQAQKQVTYNEAMQVLDVLVQPSVKSRTTTTPPGSPALGDTYLVAPAATGAWSGKDNKFASFVNGAWSFRDAANGWQAYIEDTTEFAVYQSGAWATMLTNGGASLAKFGINTAADLTNRLAVASDASLFTHDGTSHRMKLNKASVADTASLLFQTGFSARAEYGLTGDDAFHVKVSPNGSTWFEALNIAQSSGLVTLPIGQLAFPGTQNPSANANTLDDYEEGTWTPAVTFGGAAVGVTYNALTTGRYTKIGRLVVATGILALSNKGSSTGGAGITGLPFTTMNANPLSSVAVSYAVNMAAITGTVQGLIMVSDNKITLFHSNNGASAGLTNANFANTSAIYFSLSYDAS